MTAIATESHDYRIGTTAGGQPVVAAAGDGSLDSGEALQDVDRPKDRHAARGQQRTTFHARDADDEGRYYHLWQRHHDYYDDPENHRQAKEKADITEALCDALHLPAAIRRHATRLVMNCNGRAFNRIGGVYAVVLGAIAVAENSTIDTEDGFENRIQVRYITDREGERIYSHEQPRYQHIAEKVGVDWMKAISRVKEQAGGR